MTWFARLRSSSSNARSSSSGRITVSGETQYRDLVDALWLMFHAGMQRCEFLKVNEAYNILPTVGA